MLERQYRNSEPATGHRRGRRVRLLRGATIVLAAGVLVTAAACGGTKGGGSAGGGATKDTLSIGTINPPAGFNPINQSDVGGTWALNFELDPLLAQPEPLKFESKLASSFDTSDNQTFTIKLNPKAKWSDGKPVVADDVVYTLNLIANHDSATALGADINFLQGVDDVTGKLPKGKTKAPGLEAVDDQTVQFKTETKVDPNLVKELLGTKIPILPEHVLKDIKPADFDDSKYAQMPTVTDGPYKITKYTNNVSVEYTANDDYYLGKPKIKKVIQKIMPAANLAGELQTGTIQMNSGGGIGNIPVQDVQTVKKMKDITTTTSPTIAFQTIMFNNDVFKSKTMRQGMAHAINRKQIVDQLLKGEGEIVDGPYTSQSPYLDKDLQTTTYDPGLAKKLIKQSGWDMKKKINFVVPTGNQIREQAADIELQNLKAVGLNVVETKYDFPTVLSMTQKGDYDIGLMGLTFNVDPDMSNMFAEGASFNLMNYRSAKSERLLAAGKTEPDPDKRKTIYNQLQELWQDDMPMLTVYSDYATASKAKSLTVGGAKPFWPGTVSNLQEWTFGGAQ